MKKDFLLEIGCENLPSGYLDGALEQLEILVKEGLDSERVKYDSISVMGTPNRLVVRIEGLSRKQEAAEERIVGPPVSVAVTPEGTYTEAAFGFAKSQGVSPSRLSRVMTERGEYLAVVKRIRGRSTTSILKEKVPQWIISVKFPKLMSWDSSGFRFARPVRWMLSFFGENAIKLTLGNLVSSASTKLSPYFESFVTVNGIAHYFSFMQKQRIILSQQERRTVVRDMAREAAQTCGGTLVEDDELVNVVANLLESPVVLTGAFERDFLKLPREVIVTALKSHQRYFSVSGKKGKLLPSFIAFADGTRRNTKEIVKGYERVLQARLADAVFYYQEDTSRPLEEMAKKLKGVVWLEGLGNVAQKAERIEELALWLRSMWSISAERLEENIRMAAKLAKADLASEMVKDGKEFTLLQGYIGREYARAGGESEEVAESIFEHYLPRFSGDRLPERVTGILLALADRIDTITGCYIMGLEPSGSQDPYALRRQALGLLRIFMERRISVSLPETTRRSVELFRAKGLMSEETDLDELIARIQDFFRQRMNVMLRGEGNDYDLVMSVLSAPWEVPITVREMTAALQRMRDRGELTPFVLSMKRIANIIPQHMKEGFTREIGCRSLNGLANENAQELNFSIELFREDAETDLYLRAAEASRKLLDLEKSKELHRCFEVLSELVPAVNRYFDDVLVNCEDRELRDNRLSFLRNLYQSFNLFCDFFKIAGE